MFGHVVSGHDLVRQLEQLPVDRNFRPLQDAVIIKCGELVRQIKGDYFFCVLNNIYYIVCTITIVGGTVM